MRAAPFHLTALTLALTVSFSSPAVTSAAAPHWEPVGPFGGTVHAIAVAPGAPRTLYAAASGGLFRSNDAGAHWKPVRQGLPAIEVASLAIDPSDIRTLYAGLFVTDEGMAGVYKTTNGGARWEPAGLEGLQTYDLAIDPRDPSTVLAATYGGLYRSRDAGASWEMLDAVDTGSFSRIVFDPSDPGRIYSASFRGLSFSTDGGDTWKPRNRRPEPGVGALAIAPSGTLYVVQASSNSVWRSSDHGASWTLVGRIPEEFGVHALEVSLDGAFLYAGGDHGIFRSADRGATWTRRNPVGKRESVLSLAVTSDAVYTGLQFRGIAKSSDGGSSWRLAHQGLSSVLVLAAAIAPSDPRVLYVSSEGPMILRPENGGATWREVSGDTVPARLLHLTVDPRDAQRVEGVGDYGQFWRSIDGGVTWQGGGVDDAGCAFPTSLVHAPSHPNRLFWSGVLTTACDRGHEDSCHNFRSNDGGATWHCLAPIREENFRALVADPRDPAVYYGASYGGVVKSTDGGRTWEPTGFTRDVVTFVASPDGTLWAGSNSGLYRSRDGGATWVAVEGGILPDSGIWHLAIAPSNPSVLYVEGTRYRQETGYSFDLYVSTDRGTSWRRLTRAGLVPAGYYGFDPLLVDPKTAGRVYLGSESGLYRLEGANLP